MQSFKHQDWVDGVSVVQAGQTPGEEGFNDRLHRVENDLLRFKDFVEMRGRETGGWRGEIRQDRKTA